MFQLPQRDLPLHIPYSSTIRFQSRCNRHRRGSPGGPAPSYWPGSTSQWGIILKVHDTSSLPALHDLAVNRELLRAHAAYIDIPI